MRTILLLIGSLLLLALIAGTLFFLFSTAREDRAWAPEHSRTATAVVSEESVTIQNVRNWTYDSQAVLTQDWEDVSVYPNKIIRVWFLIEPFSQIKAIGHTFLSFEFEDGRVLSFSVEARREADEKYSAVLGLFNAYELTYLWGEERDFVSRRLVHLAHPLRLYPLKLSTNQAKALFLSLIQETNELKERPRFYNTLTANCTNVLAQLINRHRPGTLPYDIAWNLPGYADLYLMEERLIKTSGTKEEARAAHDLTPYREDGAILASTTPEEFSRAIRTLLRN